MFGSCTARTCCHSHAQWGVVVVSLVWSLAWRRLQIKLGRGPSSILPPSTPSTPPPLHHNRHHQRAFVVINMGPSFHRGLQASNTEVRFAYHASPCRIALSRTYTAQTWARSETSLILASKLPFGVHITGTTGHNPLWVYPGNRPSCRLPFLDRPNCVA